jgi:uncharacterized membrane protein SirB2
MYTGLLHTHKLVVLLFLLIYVVKTVLLLSNKEEALTNFTKKVKIPEMAISALFLLTGAALLFQVAEIKTLFYVKLLCVFASIPLAVVGFKKKNKVLAVLSLVLLFGGYGLAEASKKRIVKQEVAPETVTDANAATYDALAHGKALFVSNCAICHGEDGKKGLSGAKDLTISAMDEAAVEEIIKKGKNAMAPYEKILTQDEISALKAYVMTFRAK